MARLILIFEDSDTFKIISVIAAFVTLFTFAWFKLILLDKFVHSFWLKERMKRNFRCIYGYGIDEYFILERLGFLTGVLVLLFMILNGVDSLYGVFTLKNVFVETFISGTFICIYCIQLSRYESVFGFKKEIVPFVCSCIGLFITSMFVWKSVALRGLFLFFAYCFIICVKEIMIIAKTLEWGDHVVAHVKNKVFDSNEQQFYLIFYTENDITIIINEGYQFVYGKVDCIESIERIPRLSDETEGFWVPTPLYVKIIEWVMGLNIFKI